MNTVRILLSLAAHYNWQLLQYDVKNAFLYGDLDEEIYMNIPLRFEGNTGNKVCKLKKALYGLKQSLKAWFGRFAKVMKESGYIQSQETGKIGCKPVSTPMDPNHKFGEAKEEPVVDKRMYQGWLVGSYTLLTLGQTSLTRNFVKKNNTLALKAYTDADMQVPQWIEDQLQGIVLFLEIILDELRIKWDDPIKLYCDNKSTINIAHDPIQHDRTNHIEIDRHFIKEKFEEGVVCMSYVPSEH
ncbi:Retrovirus-related Pol polyprotein from transposon TNT 1-94 [Vitis vinifera]|uniref:Retrovirus-related Pol polyprotein from transposon TNT 1-94 n=1 Tax=Vitis vinifera TaxID=29760 RepID=A0A438HDG5_VITVI|nr:Retrovirus-related Pol polyprotein from transposon TNT 1-94 [Vitis vinifera]